MFEQFRSVYEASHSLWARFRMLDCGETISYIAIFRLHNRIRTLKVLTCKYIPYSIILLARVHTCCTRFSGSVFLIGTVGVGMLHVIHKATSATQ